MNPLILLDQVTVNLSGRPVFENLTWAIQRGEHWAVVGPTGSGKSVLADTLRRQRIELAHGRILYFGGDGAGCEGKAWPDPGEIGCVSSESHRELARRYTPYHQARWNSSEGETSPFVEEVLYAGVPTGSQEGLGERLVDDFGIRHLLRRKILHISNGETRRLLIARAFLQAPHVLILDDPYCGLDESSRVNLENVIDRMTRCATPQLVFITSRPWEVPAGIARVLLIEPAGIAREVRRDEMHSQAPVSMGRQPCSIDAISPPAGSEGGAWVSPIVEMRGVTVQYGDVRPLDNVSWTIRTGERWALLGHNGAGKSTLLSLILADNPQGYSNPVWVFGRRRGSGDTIWEIKRRIGFVSPELQLLYQADISCLEVVCSGFHDSIGLYHQCTAEQADRALTRMQALGVAELRNRRILSISTGQARLVLLARALVRNPSLLVLDEPCQGLDPTCRGRFLEIVDLVCADPAVSLIYVTHRPEEIPACVSHRLVLEHGRVVRIGPR